MKIVKNNCFGGFSLSPLAVKRLAELDGKECHFFKFGFGEEMNSISIEDIGEREFMWTAFSVSNPEEHLPKEKIGEDGTYKAYNEAYEKICLDNRPSERHNKNLIKVVEELGKKANGICAELAVVEIPDGTDYRIDEYDGLETIAEGRTW